MQVQLDFSFHNQHNKCSPPTYCRCSNRETNKYKFIYSTIIFNELQIILFICKRKGVGLNGCDFSFTFIDVYFTVKHCSAPHFISGRRSPDVRKMHTSGPETTKWFLQQQTKNLYETATCMSCCMQTRRDQRDTILVLTLPAFKHYIVLSLLYTKAEIICWWVSEQYKDCSTCTFLLVRSNSLPLYLAFSDKFNNVLMFIIHLSYLCILNYYNASTLRLK